MRATKVKVEHMEDRLYIYRNYCLQDIDGKTWLDHLIPLKEIKAYPILHILTEYQKWVDEPSYLVDATMGVYQVDTSPENVDLEMMKKRSACLRGSTVWQFRKNDLVGSVYIKDFFEPFPSPRHYLKMCVYVSPHVVCVCVCVHIVS